MGSRRPLCRRYPIHNYKCQGDFSAAWNDLYNFAVKKVNGSR